MKRMKMIFGTKILKENLTNLQEVLIMDNLINYLPQEAVLAVREGRQEDFDNLIVFIDMCV